MHVKDAVHQALLPRRLERKDARDPERERDDLNRELKRIQDGINTFAEEAKKRHGELSAETKSKVDELLVEQTKVTSRLSEVEKLMAKMKEDPGEVVEKTLGEIITANAAVQEIMKNFGGKARFTFDRKVVSGVSAGAGGALVRNDRLQTILELPERRLTVRDLILPGSTTSSAIEYVRQTALTNNAAVVAETAAKPESNLTFDLITTAVVTIAHWIKASKQILADAPQLQTFINGQLEYGLKLKEEAQLLLGSGSGGNLNGIYTQATAYAEPIDIGRLVKKIDLLRLAMLQATLNEFPPTGMVMHPSDWAAIELTQDANDRYLFANPQALTGPRLWGLPVVATQAMTVATFLVGAFRPCAQVFDRQDVVALVSTEDADNFTKNMVTILLEERLALAVYRPTAFIKGTLADEVPA
jgi:HK97 family phage major capsid protein